MSRSGRRVLVTGNSPSWMFDLWTTVLVRFSPRFIYLKRGKNTGMKARANGITPVVKRKGQKDGREDYQRIKGSEERK